ncbi:IMP dehydrogenase [soil metagenome]
MAAANQYLDEFMEHHRFTGLTYDDVSMVTQYADFLPADTDLSSQLTRGIRLNIPFVSAAMDTVTESHMGIAMALAGGIGIIHKNLEPTAQRTEIKKVKYYLNGFLVKARTIDASMTIGDVERMKEEKGFHFSSFPVLDENRKLLGIVTASQFRYAASPETRIADIMVRNTVTARPETTLREAYDILLRHKISILPVVEADGSFRGLYSFKDVSRIIRMESPLQNVDERYSLRVGAAVGPADHERIECLLDTNVDALVVDTAHGHSKGVIDMVKWIKSRWPEQQAIAGNVAAAEGARALADAGADAIKVGIGPGSICTTRIVAGVGVPQLSAVYTCARELRGSGVPVIADGGIKTSGDVAKALAAGASSVMMGSVFAGTDESPGERVLISGRQYISYRGMGSIGAMAQRHGSADRYGQKSVASQKLVPEGIEGLVPYSGPVAGVLHQFSGGLRGSLGYNGARNLEILRNTARFVRVTESGKRESHPHDIEFVKDAPNYRMERE